MTFWCLLLGVLGGSAMYHYPDRTTEVLYTIVHTTLEAGAYVQIKLCPKEKKRRMKAPTMSEAAKLLSAAASSAPKAE